MLKADRLTLPCCDKGTHVSGMYRLMNCAEPSASNVSPVRKLAAEIRYLIRRVGHVLGLVQATGLAALDDHERRAHKKCRVLDVGALLAVEQRAGANDRLIEGGVQRPESPHTGA